MFSSCLGTGDNNHNVGKRRKLATNSCVDPIRRSGVEENSTSINEATVSSDAALLKLPESRSLQDWQSFSRETLILFSQSAHLPITGSSAILAQALFDRFSQQLPQDVQPPQDGLEPPVTTTATPNPTTTPPSVSVTSPPLDQHIFNNTQPASIPVVLPPIPHSDQVAQTSPPSTSPLGIEIGSAVAAALQPFMATLSSIVLQSNGNRFTESPLTNPSPNNINTTSRQNQNISFNQNANTLPAIPHSVLEKIRLGEFINFDLLLPNNVPSRSTTTSFTLSLDGSSSSDSPQILIKNNNNNGRNKVNDLHSWLLAWSLFSRLLLCFVDI